MWFIKKKMMVFNFGGMTKKQLKHEIFAVLDARDHHNKLSKAFNIFLIILISLNVVAVSLETVENIYLSYEKAFRVFEVISVVIFTIEYLLRVWSVTSSDDPRYSHPVWGRLRFIFTFSTLIDLLAFLPFYLPMFIGLRPSFYKGITVVAVGSHT